MQWAIPSNNYTPLLMTKNVVQRGSNGNVLRGCSIAVRCAQRESNGNVLGVSHSEICPEGWGCPKSGCVQRGFNGNVLYRGMSYIRMCPEGVQLKCPEGVSYIMMCPEGVQW